MAGSGFNYPSDWNVYNFSDPNGSILNTTGSGSYLLSNNNGITGSTGYGIGNAVNLSNPTMVNALSMPTSGIANTASNALNKLGAAKSAFMSANPTTGTSSFASWMRSLQSKLGSGNNVASNAYDQGFLGSNAMGNVLGAVGLGLGALSGIGSYLNGKKYMSMLKDQMAQQNAQFNETYNNKLKEYNTSLADRLRARAAFETGNSSAYNDEITNNSLSRGQTGNANSSYLNYKRSENAV